MALGMQLTTLADLETHEAEIIAEINGRPNGGLMFAIDPLRMLDYIGVKLGPELTERLPTAFPLIARPARQASAFERLRTTDLKQPLRVVVKGLVRGIST